MTINTNITQLLDVSYYFIGSINKNNIILYIRDVIIIDKFN